MIVADIMSRGIATITSDASYRDVWEKIVKKHVNALPVVDSRKKLVGIITREDLLNPLYPKYQDIMESLESAHDFEEMESKISELSGLSAKSVMSKRVIYTRQSTLIMRALSRMIVRSVDQLPVLDENDKVIGIITKGDVFAVLFKKYLKNTKNKK